MNNGDPIQMWEATVSDEFMKRGACRGMDVNLFMPKVGQTAKEARAICIGTPPTRTEPGTPACPVKKECLEYALSIPGPLVGIWAGTSERERRRLRKDQPVTVKPRRLRHEHGTERGYQQHHHQGSRPCDACRAAHAAHYRAFRDPARDAVTKPALRELMTLVSQVNASSRTA